MQTPAASHAGLHQVEREVAGARADLERAGERGRVAAKELLDLPSTCARPTGPKSTPHFASYSAAATSW